jgi:hypothetical protein
MGNGSNRQSQKMKNRSRQLRKQKRVIRHAALTKAARATTKPTGVKKPAAPAAAAKPTVKKAAPVA